MKNKLLKSIFGLFAAGMITATGHSGAEPVEPVPDSLYARTCVILQAYHTPDWTGYMIVADWGHYQDGRMHAWVIDEDPEDLARGEVLSCLMHDNNTPDILDDYIVNYRYGGLADEALLDD